MTNQTNFEPPYILTLDIGTSSTRVMLFDRNGRAVDGVSAHEPAKHHVSADGAAEQDPTEAVERVARCIDSALAQAGSRTGAIAAVAVDTYVSNLIALDEKGQALTPIVLYADTRNAADAEQLRSQLNEQTVHDRTGCLLRTAYWPARLAWLRRTQPELWQRVARFGTLGEYLEAQLFGSSRVSSSVASWSGLLDRRTLQWDAPLLDALGVHSEQLGELVDACVPLRGLRAPFRSRWPALADVPWFPAIGDGAAANLGSGCVDERTLALTIGTTGALRVVRTDTPEIPAGLWCYRIDARRALLGGATSEGGNVFAWMHGALRFEADAASMEALDAMAPDAHGLTILPLLAGERSPGWAGNAKATISGITISTTPLEIVRAGLEAVAYRFALIAETLIAPEATPTIIASGGALLQSPTWMQICADVLGRTVVASAETEATSRGAALLALEALGATPDLATLPAALGASFMPDPARHACYRDAIQRQQWLYDQLIRGT